MLQLSHSTQPRIQPTVSPHIVARSVLLELGYADLVSRIEHEVAENPALDTVPETEDDGAIPASRLSLRYSGDSLGSSGRAPQFDSLPAPYSLQDDLRWQFRATTTRSLHEIGETLISNIDDEGYLRLDIFELAQDLAVPLQSVQEALAHLQSLSPVGVGARSLRECLGLQLQAKVDSTEPVPQPVAAVLQHFAAYSEGDIQRQLVKATGLEGEEVKQALDYIREHLHPYPGHQFRSLLRQDRPDQYTYPDAAIYYDGKELQVDIPQAQSRMLCLSQAYSRLERAMQRGEADLSAEQVEQVHEQIRQARRFIDMLQQRHDIMLRITQAIVQQQSGLIMEGVMSLVPLTKKQIAVQTGMHESTVSRATRSKHVMLPTGILLPFDIFFEDALPIKALLAHIIQHEAPATPLTDEQLAGILTQRGHKLARRTVTKYRRQMGILSSRQRHNSP